MIRAAKEGNLLLSRNYPFHSFKGGEEGRDEITRFIEEGRGYHLERGVSVMSSMASKTAPFLMILDTEEAKGSSDSLAQI